MQTWLKEPLVHFVVAGALLFAVYAWLDRDIRTDDEPRAIRVTAAEVEWLAGIWARQWGRPPDQQELRGVVTDYLKEQLLAREALELGLDVDDTVVRRRLAQKMEFLVEDTIRFAEPDEAALRTLYAAEGARYVTPARVSFTQGFFRTATRAEQGLAELVRDANAEVGDRTLLDSDYVRVDERTVASVFGAEFAAQVLALEPGAWQGPIASAYGFHLVRVGARESSAARPFEDVREQVLEEWRYLERAKAEERFFAALLDKYELVVDESLVPLVASLAEGAQ